MRAWTESIAVTIQKALPLAVVMTALFVISLPQPVHAISRSKTAQR
jgi:hypothetical protein